MAVEAPAGFEPFYQSDGGVSYFWRDKPEGGFEIAASQDITAILDRNKAMANHNDGYSRSREMRRVATIPSIIQQKWLREEGWDAYDPHHADKLMQKLNDPDWRYLRTAEGHLGPTQDGGFR